jgi:hypothetical protein
MRETGKLYYKSPTAHKWDKQHEMHVKVQPKQKPESDNKFESAGTPKEPLPSRVFKKRCPECNVKFSSEDEFQMLLLYSRYQRFA